MAPTPEHDTPRGDPHTDEGAGGVRARAHLTSRAAILAIVMCAIALSLAYPVREYIAQRREIAALRHQEQDTQKSVNDLTQAKQRLGDKSYIEREARERLNFCMPGDKCYVVLDGGNGSGSTAKQTGSRSTPPWYATLWQSVKTADKRH